ncbi:MAG: hypothetical protein WED86_00630 [Chloroflexota bacterium]
MSFEEKSTWIQVVVVIVAPGVYFLTIIGQLRTTPVAEIAYQGAMLWSVGVAVAAIVAATIVISIASPKEADKSDERDTNINRFGEYIGSYPLYAGGVLALFFALAEFKHFWIANTLYATFVLAGLTTTVVKLLAYRRGF